VEGEGLDVRYRRKKGIITRKHEDMKREKLPIKAVVRPQP
jgi:hypothetical protein